MGAISSGQVRSGLLWVAATTLLRDGVQFATALILVRLLDARAYGEFALATSIAGLLTAVGFHNFLEYALQMRPGEDVDWQSQWTFGGIAQAVAIAVLNLIAVLLRRVPAYAAVAPALSVMSVAFAADWAAELRVKMLERDLRWTRLRSLEAAGILLSAASAVGLAWRGAGVYALLLPSSVGLLPFIYDLFFVAGWRPSWRLDWNRFRPAWRYGWTRAGSGLAARGQEALESAVMAAVIGLVPLGVYGRAVSLASFACRKLTSVMTLTLFPMVTRYEAGSEEFRRASGLVLRAVAWTALPAATIVGICAGPIVTLLYGPRWPGVIPLLPSAVYVAALLAVMEATAFLLLTNLQARRTFALDILHLGGTALALPLVSRGLVQYLHALGIVQVVLVGTGLRWLLRGGGIHRVAVMEALVPGGISLAIGATIGSVWTPRTVGQAALFVLVFAGLFAAAVRIVYPNAAAAFLRFLPLSTARKQ